MIAWSDFPEGDHRARCPACQRRDKSMGVTVLGPGHGVAHCFRCGFVETRHNARELTPAERKAYARRMDALRAQHDAEQLARQAEAATQAAIRWSSSKPATEHPYLTTKGVQSHGLRIDRQSLLIPLRDSKGTLQSLQTIGPDGDKRFLPGGRVKGCYHSIGKPAGRLVIAEGYATAATVHEDTGHAVAVAFNSGNLLHVAQALRAKYPEAVLVLAADDDWQTPGNPGRTAATEAARAVSGLLAVPDFTGLQRGPKDTDFNDLRRLAQAVEVCQ